ncbi:ATP-binding protein [Gammaproteobacteria bacterium]|nr:ATP-binding protein [Gammaproteobacteria bacterium]
MKKVKLAPSAASLSESLRDIGYTLETAIADLIDNSITASATIVRIFINSNSTSPSISIVDNGHGMTQDELREAMKLGTKHTIIRSKDDLGRFGLGLKTASFSQCRKLTVLSKCNSEYSSACWDLDEIDEEDEWYLSILDQTEIKKQISYKELDDYKSGTVVIWENLDRLTEGLSGDKLTTNINEKNLILERHLSLVFHRFLSSDVPGRKNLSIYINNHKITSFDPFLKSNMATRELNREILTIEGEKVSIQPYILPHHSKLSASEHEYYDDRNNFMSNQGIYIYRNSRLMVWGDWFRLINRSESTKLARIQIDFTNHLDYIWTIDIKKSKATLPYSVKEKLRQVIDKIKDSSIQVSRSRGQKLYQEDKIVIWNRYIEDGTIKYRLNQEHPVLKNLKKNISNKQFEELVVYLDLITSELPLEAIYADYSTSARNVRQDEVDESQAKQLLDNLNSMFDNKTEEFNSLLESLRIFDAHKELLQKYMSQDNGTN